MNMICHCCDVEPGSPCPSCITPIPEKLLATISGITLGTDPFTTVDTIELNGAFVLEEPINEFGTSCQRRYRFASPEGGLSSAEMIYTVEVRFSSVSSSEEILVWVRVQLGRYIAGPAGLILLTDTVGIFDIYVPWIDGRIPCGQLFPRTFDFVSQENNGANYIDTSGATITLVAAA